MALEAGNFATRFNNGALEMTNNGGASWAPVSLGLNPAGQAIFLKALIPALNAFEYQKIGQYSLGTAVATSFTASANVEGGGVSPASGAPGLSTFGSPVFNTCNTGRWGLSIRGKLAAPVAARVSRLGLVNSGTAHLVTVSTDFANDTTKYLLVLGGAGTTIGTPVGGGLVAAAVFHWFTLTGDGATINLYVDGVLVSTTPVTANVVDEPLALIAVNTTAGDAVITHAVYGYVAPT